MAQMMDSMYMDDRLKKMEQSLFSMENNTASNFKKEFQSLRNFVSNVETKVMSTMSNKNYVSRLNAIKMKIDMDKRIGNNKVWMRDFRAMFNSINKLIVLVSSAKISPSITPARLKWDCGTYFKNLDKELKEALNVEGLFSKSVILKLSAIKTYETVFDRIIRMIYDIEKDFSSEYFNAYKKYKDDKNIEELYIAKMELIKQAVITISRVLMHWAGYIGADIILIENKYLPDNNL